MTTLNELNYVQEAERVIKSLITKDKQRKGDKRITNSQIRNLLEMTANLYTRARMVSGEKINASLQGDVQYVKMKFIYAAGRETAVKTFIERADLFNHFDSVNDEKPKLILLCKYMESLVAYHTFYYGE